MFPAHMASLDKKKDFFDFFPLIKKQKLTKTSSQKCIIFGKDRNGILRKPVATLVSAVQKRKDNVFRSDHAGGQTSCFQFEDIDSLREDVCKCWKRAVGDCIGSAKVSHTCVWAQSYHWDRPQTVGVNLSETTKWGPSQATEDVAQTHQVWPCGVLYSRKRAGHFRLPWQSTSQWNQTIVVVEELGLERSTLKRFKDSSSADETSRVIMEYVLKGWLSEKEQVDELTEGILEFQGRVECWRCHVV